MDRSMTAWLACSADGAAARADLAVLAPPLEALAPELLALVADDILGRGRGLADGLGEEGDDLLAVGLLAEDGDAHGSPGEVVNAHGQPPAERPALRQSKGQPGSPEAAQRNGCQVHVPDVVRTAYGASGSAAPSPEIGKVGSDIEQECSTTLPPPRPQRREKIILFNPLLLQHLREPIPPPDPRIVIKPALLTEGQSAPIRPRTAHPPPDIGNVRILRATTSAPCRRRPACYNTPGNRHLDRSGEELPSPRSTAHR